MLGKGHEAKAVFGSPDFHLSVIASSGEERAVGTVSHAVQVEEVALLFEHICFTLPLPHEKLPLLLAAEGDPLGSCVQTDRVNTILGYLERLQRLEVV